MSRAVAVRSLLIVDGSPAERAALRRMLRDAGAAYTISEAESGADALRQLSAARPDCVLLDFRLPDMDAPDWLAAAAAQAGGNPPAEAAGRLTPGARRAGDGEQAQPAARALEANTAEPAQEDDAGVPALPCAVAIITGPDDAAAAALAAGAQDYLVKGTLTPHGLQRLVENAIGKFAIQRELHEKRELLEIRNRQLEWLRSQTESNLAELVDATRAKDRFMAVMSHEMRTPLNAVLGYADLLDMNVGGELSAAQREYVERIRVGSRHLLELINDVLDVARLDARKLELDLRPVDAHAIAEEVIALLESHAGTKGIALRLERVHTALPLVEADVNRLRQIVTNLVGNAIKFTDSGEVAVSIRAGEDRVELEVRDTGIGIDPEALPLIFTEFFQADGDLTRRQGGSGIGLAISQRLAQLMGGGIHVQSRPGAGSSFTLSLPRARAGSEARAEDVESHAERMQAQPLVARAPGETERAVVVAYSDNADGLAQLRDRVFPGVRLVWTTSAHEVPRLAREERASLVVLDIGCDGGAGWTAAHALREDPALGAVAVLLLPCIPAAVSEEPGRGLDLGWVTLVPKPFTPDQLTRAVYSAARDGMEGTEGVPAIDVLMVDDDPDSRRVASSFLHTGNVRVREVGDGETALAEMRRRPPHVAVLDLMMPVLDGFGVLAAMRADPLLMRVPVVVLSAKSLSEAERQFLARSAVRVLQKGEHRLSDVAALVLRAAAGSARDG